MAGDLLDQRPPLPGLRACWVLNHYAAAVGARLPTARRLGPLGLLPSVGETQATADTSIGMAMASGAKSEGRR